MQKKYRMIWIRLFFISLNVVTTLTLALALVNWDDPRSFYSVIWDYPTVRLYVLISISTFATLNVFQRIEFLLTKQPSSIWAKNAKAMWGYLLGTVIYFVVGIFVFDVKARVATLIIPIAFTIIGFNLNRLAQSERISRKQVLIMANIALLVFWSMTTIYMTVDLHYEKRDIAAAQVKIEKIDAEFLSRADSLRAVFDRSNLLDRRQLDNETLKSLVIAQLELHKKFTEFKNVNEYTKYVHADYLLNYKEMITMLQVGLLMVVLLNSLYLVYLINDSKNNLK